MTDELLLTPDMEARNILARLVSETRRKRTHNRRNGQLKGRQTREELGLPKARALR
jgi:hypothetical protein